jgi:hypothetical protein
MKDIPVGGLATTIIHYLSRNKALKNKRQSSLDLLIMSVGRKICISKK